MFLHRSVKLPSRLGTIAAQVVVQQAVYNPVFNVYFMGMHSLLGGHGIKDTIDHLAFVLPTSIVRGAQVWTGVAIVSFSVVPPQWRGIFSGCVAVCWQTYLGCLARFRGESKE